MRSAWGLLVIACACGTVPPPSRELKPEAVTEIWAGAIGHGELRVGPRHELRSGTLTLRSAVWVKNPCGLTETVVFSCSLHDGTERYISPTGQQGFIPATRPTWDTLRSMNRQHVIVLLHYYGGSWWLADQYDGTALLPYTDEEWRRVTELVAWHRSLAAQARARTPSPASDALFARLVAADADHDDVLGAGFAELGADSIPTLLRALDDDRPIRGLWMKAWGSCSPTWWIGSTNQLARYFLERCTGVGWPGGIPEDDPLDAQLATDGYRVLGAYALATPSGRITSWMARRPPG
jgi:hypothetical protein